MIGNLTRDPDYKQQPSGQALCKLSLALNRQYRNKQTGMAVQEVTYVDVDVWGPQAEHCKQYLQKGRQVFIEGRLKLDSWTEPDGQKRRRLFVIADSVTFLGSGKTAETGFEETPGTPQSQAAQGAVPQSVFKDEPFEDDLPF